jgi:simple sugar transport system permease protein
MIEAMVLFATALRISVPYALAAMGAALSERAGVICIALEGLMLHGALAYVLGAHAWGSPWIGLLCALAAGLVTAAVHGVVTLHFKADQITSGLGINLLASGLTRFLLQRVFDSSSNSPRVVGLPELPLGPLAAVPGLGPLLATPLVLLTLVLVPCVHHLLFRTPLGLRLRAVGEHPEAVAALGLSVTRLRWAGVLTCGALAALGGAWLASEQHSFTDGMTGGRGYIALAAMIVGKWSPLGAAAACLLFGAAEAAQIRLQGSAFPSDLLQALPYAVTMLALAGFIGRAVAPRAIGRPFDRDAH